MNLLSGNIAEVAISGAESKTRNRKQNRWCLSQNLKKISKKKKKILDY